MRTSSAYSSEHSGFVSYSAPFLWLDKVAKPFVAQYLPMITQARDMLTKARKKTYTVSVGKLNPSKLANFMEIECFVLIACPENSIIDSKVCVQHLVRRVGDELRCGTISGFSATYHHSIRAWPRVG